MEADIETKPARGLMEADRRPWPGLDADMDRFAPTAGRTRPARVAIASYEFNGIVRNGGIGTACTSLGRALAAEGHEVDLFFTGWADDPSAEAFERCAREYAAEGMSLHWFDYAALAGRYDAPVYSAAHSFALYRQLAERDSKRPYDAIHFVESVGHGFYPLLAKRQGLAFERATMVVGAHSPRRWMAEAHGELFDSPEYLADEFLERRSLELADVVVSPSAHMLDWLTARGVCLPQRSYVQQYVTDFKASGDLPAGTDAETSAIEELVFFGRLEPRKGLPAFCEALELLAERSYGQLRKVTFMGRHAPVDGVQSDEYIAVCAERWPWEHHVLSDFDRDDALRYLRQPGRLAVMASPMDNSPNTVYEAIGMGIPFLASSGGGIAELVHPDDRDDMTFDPSDREREQIDPADPRRTRSSQTGTALAKHLERALHGPSRVARFAVDPAANREAHLAWHRAVAGASTTLSFDGPSAGRENGGPPLTVVDVDDIQALEPGAGDDFILLLDPGVEREPRLGSALLAAATSSPEPALVTSLGRHDLEAADGSKKESCFLPTGGPALFGVVANCFGTGALLARRSTLERLGVFDGPDAGLDIGVGGVLARASIRGERIDIVPEALYRVPGTSPPHASLSKWADQLEAMRPYHQRFGPEAAPLADMAWRLARQRDELHGRAVLAEHQLTDAVQRLEVVTTSRSWRLTGLLRRAASRLRRRKG